jgi:hypothetical protein
MPKLSTKMWVGIGVVTGVVGYFLWEATSASAAAPLPIKAPSKGGGIAPSGGGSTPKPQSSQPAAPPTSSAPPPVSADTSSPPSTPSGPPDLTDADKQNAFNFGNPLGVAAADADHANGTTTSAPDSYPDFGTDMKSVALYPDVAAGWAAGYATEAANIAAKAVTSGYSRLPRAGVFHPSMYGYPQDIYGRRLGWN